MASSLKTVIEGIRTKLLATSAVTSLLVSSTAVYDHVASGATGEYIEIGDGFEDDNDSFSKSGKIANVFVTIWSNKRSWSAIGSIESAVADALDRETITLTGTNFIFCNHVRTQRTKEIDETRRSELQFEVYTKES